MLKKDSRKRQYFVLLPCLQTIRALDRDYRTVTGRTRYVTSPIWSRIDWLISLKIRIVGLSFAELKLDKTVHLEFYLPLSGGGGGGGREQTSTLIEYFNFMTS